MRIATSTVYDNQVSSIDNLVSQYQQYGNVLSTGKQLNAPSDDPTEIAQDLSIRTDNAVTTQVGKNLTNLSSELASVDGSLSSLTSVLQSARQLAIQGASGTITPQQQGEMANQVDQLLQEAIGLANTQYGGKYVFAGTNVPSSQPLVKGVGSPISSVVAQGNNVQQTHELPNGQSVPTGVTLQQAFNFGATDGSPDVFQMLITLRDTLAKNQIVDKSGQQVNLPGTAIVAGAAGTTVNALLSGAVPQILATPLQPDNSLPAPGNVSISIASAQAVNGVTITFNPGDTMTGGPASIVGKINAQTAATGVTASFNFQTQRLVLTSASGPFQVRDVPSPGATTSSNFTAAFNLTQQADIVNNLSTQIGDIDHTLQTTLGARSQVGSVIQEVQSLNGTANSQVLNDTKVQSSIEDADIAKVVSQFSQTQTALQAAYGTTTRLESKTLFDYL
jgi:flagellar hook-associated protein 3 FlgL